MTRAYRNEMTELLEVIESDPQVPARLRSSVQRLRHLSWCSDVEDLAQLWRYCPQSVERYLDLMVSQLHEFPSASSKAAATCA